MSLASKSESARLPAFAYPKQLHRRGSDPGPFTNYRTYKPYLRDEFRGACVYCRVRDSLNRESLFAVEHYLPQHRFAGLVTEWTNLFYACQSCNGAKRGFFPRGKRKTVEYVPNPCSDVMFSHLRYQGANVVHRSATGAFAIELLDLNDPKSVAYREFFQQSIDAARLGLTKATKLVTDIEVQLRTATGLRATQLRDGLRLAQAKREVQEHRLRYVTGPFED